MEDTDVVDVEPDPDDINSTYVVFYPYNDPRWGEPDPEAAIPTPSLPMPALARPMDSIPNLHDVNTRKVSLFIPIFIFMGMLLVLAVLSNLLVCYIYRCRSRRATSNLFVIFFAIFDLVGCLVGFLVELFALIFPYTYDILALCRLMSFLRSVLVCSLSLTLMCVAYDCYRKVCRPGDEIGVKKARVHCIASIVVAVLLSIPALPLFGIKQVETEVRNITGQTCATGPDQPQWLRILYYVCILFPFTFSLAAMSLFYGLVGVNWCREKQAEERGEKCSPVKSQFPKKHRFTSKEENSSRYTEELSRLHSQSNLSHASQSSALHDPARIPLKSNGATALKKTDSLQATAASRGAVVAFPLHVKNTRQASIFMVISVLFVVFMLPFVVVTVLSATTTIFDSFSVDQTELAFNFCVRSYLLNYLSKPLVYFIFNIKFRKEVKHLFIKMWTLCTRSGPDQHSACQPTPLAAPRSPSRNLLSRNSPGTVNIKTTPTSKSLKRMDNVAASPSQSPSTFRAREWRSGMR